MFFVIPLFHRFIVKVAVVLLAFGFACVSAGSYGGQGHGMGYQHYAQYVQPQYIQPRPQYAQVQYYQPVGANVGGSGSGNLLGGSGSLGGGYGGGGYGGGIGGGIGGGSGAIIPIIIICKYSLFNFFNEYLFE